MRLTTTAFEILRIKSVAPFSHRHVFNASLACYVLPWGGKLVLNAKFASMVEGLLISINQVNVFAGVIARLLLELGYCLHVFR